MLSYMEMNELCIRVMFLSFHMLPKAIFVDYFTDTDKVIIRLHFSIDFLLLIVLCWQTGQYFNSDVTFLWTEQFTVYLSIVTKVCLKKK